MLQKNIADEKRVSPEELCRTLDPTVFSFDTTAEIEPLTGTIGQERALKAIQAGLETGADGFNIYASGRVGTGRNSTVKALVGEKACECKPPNDWCYVYNFEKPDNPKALELPPGKAQEMAEEMEHLLQECREEIPRAFESEDYEKKRANVRQEFQNRRQEIIDELRGKARQLDHDIQVSAAGIMSVPMLNGDSLSQEEFDDLDEGKKEDLREKNEKVQELIAKSISRAKKAEEEAKGKASELDTRVGLFAVGHIMDQLREKYRDFPEVVSYLKQVQGDIIDNIDIFKEPGGASQDPFGLQAAMRNQTFNRYRVNVIVDNSETDGAPVIDERNPTYYNLFGQLEYRSEFGGMTTDFTMIKAGAFLRANGGYLVLQALDLLMNPFAWEALKRTLRTGEVRIENMWEQYRPVPVATLEPMPIPVDVKVILVGSPVLYELLYFLDKDFCRLFKIKADFDIDMEFSDEQMNRYAAFIARQCEEHDLPAFSSDAIARLVEHGVRLSEDRERLTTEFLQISDLIVESARLAGSNGNGSVQGEDVLAAIDEREERLRMVQDKIQRVIDDGTLLIDTEGREVGQLNGLAVLELGGYRFGKPSRITCVASVGQAGVVNIERESKMSGSIHNKGVMILTGYLAGRFGYNKPLSLTASICFEQSYSQVDGDSASCAELYALLSSLADLPLKQGIAVTGSVNQKGQVQPIGGVNEKIEGFFEICQKNGLTGEQGVLIPARNLKHLMLKRKVVDAVQEGKFHVYAVDTVEEGIQILTDMPAGKKDAQGEYPANTVFGRVDKRLCEMADVLKEYGGGQEDGPTDD